MRLLVSNINLHLGLGLGLGMHLGSDLGLGSGYSISRRRPRLIKSRYTQFAGLLFRVTVWTLVTHVLLVPMAVRQGWIQNRVETKYNREN